MPDDGRNPDEARIFTHAIVARLRADCVRLKANFGAPAKGRVRCCWLDDLLPDSAVADAQREMPPLSSMVRRADRKERKYVSANLDTLGPTLRNMVVALAQQPIADMVSEIMGKAHLEVDPRLYNGGVTSMVQGDFMCPHLDNSHDYDRVRRRDVVLLYYLSPDWRPEYGGGLELWSRRRGGTSQPVAFRSNRLVILETTEASWHSIRPIVGPHPRVSLTTYYYAPAAVKTPLRLTRFTGWPGEPLRAAMFSTEFHLRNAAARVVGRRLTGNRHAYRARVTPIDDEQGTAKT